MDASKLSSNKDMNTPRIQFHLNPSSSMQKVSILVNGQLVDFSPPDVHSMEFYGKSFDPIKCCVVFYSITSYQTKHIYLY